MSTLFFEGFEKGVILNRLDNNYWSTQFKQYPKYSFGGYTPSGYVFQGGSFFDAQYRYSSPNNGILPITGYVQDFDGNGIRRPGNKYPGLGSPPGFLAITNIEIENPSSVEFPTYLKLSGFPLPSGDQTYFGFRSLGLETSNTDHSSYPHRHQLFSFCSGNVSCLSVNIVKITGNTLNTLNNEKATMALEIQQNNQTLGYFDLDISSSLDRFRIASLFSTSNKILTIADTGTSNHESRNGTGNYDGASFISRWTHSEFLIDDSDASQSYLNVKAEGVDLSVVNYDPDIERLDWEISLPISGFKFDNIRFYNRTYSSSILQNMSLGETVYGGNNNIVVNPMSFEETKSRYYMHGQVWLLDDVTLIDNINRPSFWLGPTCKVLPLTPGITNNLTDGAFRSDGIKEWTSTPANSHRRALAILDGDAGKIETINSGNIDAVALSVIQPTNSIYYNGVDTQSLWRYSFNDAIGGMKAYNVAKKNYLDTKFINVFYGGVASDPYSGYVSLLLHNDNSIIDSSDSPKSLEIRGDVSLPSTISKFGNSSLHFPNANSYIVLNHPDFESDPFTIESWVYFTNEADTISLFDKSSTSVQGQNYTNRTYNFLTNINGIILEGKSYSTRILYFPTTATTGTWHHVAITRDSDNRLICYLNGQSGVNHTVYRTYGDGGCDPSGIFTNSLHVLQGNCNQNVLQTRFSNSNGDNVIPALLTIGKAGYIDEYRVSLGVVRYSSNFSPPTGQFKTQRDDYITVGPEHLVKKTVYQTYQYYANHNPATQQNWTVPQITGMIFGVKKL
jgi:hypothetical protein